MAASAASAAVDLTEAGSGEGRDGEVGVFVSFERVQVRAAGREEAGLAEGARHSAAPPGRTADTHAHSGTRNPNSPAGVAAVLSPLRLPVRLFRPAR